MSRMAGTLGTCALFMMSWAPAIAAQSASVDRQDPSPGCRGFSFSFSGSGDTVHDYPVVVDVPSGSPGELAGLRVGDLLVEVQGENLMTFFSTVAAGRPVPNLWRHPAGTKVPVLVQREGEEREVTLVLGRRVNTPSADGGPRQCLPAEPVALSR